MMKISSTPRWFFAALSIYALAACAPQAERIASAASPERAARPEVDWAFEASDIPVDTEFRFGKLENGMRYVIRQNATPKGTALVRLGVAAGSLDEKDGEEGYAHFVEHMAFNGSKNVPEGEMVRLLERDGLAFGADTNASTGFERTTYKLDLPRNDLTLLDTALMLMRETAGRLTFAPESVARERGVVLSELRDRSTFSLKNSIDTAEFSHPDALYPKRFPIGTTEALNAATAQTLKAFWEREYIPAHAVVIVVGDFDPDLVEAGIVKHFSDWEARPADPQPGGGPVNLDDAGRTHIFIDPAQPERITAFQHGPFLDEPDTVAQRQENLLRSIGYDIVNRRFQRAARQPSPPFRGAGFGTGDVFKAARSTRLIVDTSDRKWRYGLISAVQEYRRALQYGFSDSEVAEQVANIRTSIINGAASAETRSHHALAGAAWRLIEDDQVPSDPRTVLQRFEEFAPDITTQAVLAALKREAVVLDNPLLRFRGRYAPEGGENAIREAWNEAMRQTLVRPQDASNDAFAYTDFGPAGEVVADKREPALGIRTVRFGNGVILNLKHTDLKKDRIRVKLSIDGGRKLNSMENPLATELVPYLGEGGLGQHSEDDLQTILAGRTVSNGMKAGDETFVANARTTPRDLELQLQLMAAYISDPGYRREGLERYRQDINRYFAQLDATPASALRGGIGGIISDKDPRFTTLPPDAYRKLTFADLSQAISDRLARGALEIGMTGDLDEDRAIALVARTFGALPTREATFRSYDEQPARIFSADRSQRILRHTGQSDQALLRLTWPTRDDSDPIEAMKLELLERVVRVALTEKLREALGKAYSPSASSSLSRSWQGYGTFGIAASVAQNDVVATRAAIFETLDTLREAPVAQDLLQRARQPMIEGLNKALKSNAGWLALVDRAQSEADRIERFVKAPHRLTSLTAADVQTMALRYLDPDNALEILVLHENAPVPEGVASHP